MATAADETIMDIYTCMIVFCQCWAKPKLSQWMHVQNTLNHAFTGISTDTMCRDRNVRQDLDVVVTGAVSMNGTNASENTFNKLICPVCVAQLNKCSFWKNDVAITSLTSETRSHERKAETVQAKHNSSKYLSVQCEF